MRLTPVACIPHFERCLGVQAPPRLHASAAQPGDNSLGCDTAYTCRAGRRTAEHQARTAVIS